MHLKLIMTLRTLAITGGKRAHLNKVRATESLNIAYFIPEYFSLRERLFGMIQKRITDPRSLGSRCLKGTKESSPRVDASAPLMHRDPSDLGSLILFRIILKERTLKALLDWEMFRATCRPMFWRHCGGTSCTKHFTVDIPCNGQNRCETSCTKSRT